MKNKTHIKFFACLLCLVLIGATLLSCGKTSDEDMLATAKELCEASVKINEICFGAGITPLKDGYKSGTYTEADPASMQTFGVDREQDIKNLLNAVYTVHTVDWMQEQLFDATLVDGVMVSASRYYDGEKILSDGKTVPVLMVNHAYEPLTEGQASYSNFTLLQNKRKKAVISVDITVTKDGKSQTYQGVELILRREMDAWRLETPTYATFDSES